MNFILELWEGLRTLMIGKYHISTFASLFQFTWGCFLHYFFFSAALGDSSQEATRRHCSGSTDLLSLSAWRARNQNPVFQTESSSWGRSIHPPTTTLTTTKYSQKPANTPSALLRWCFALETLSHTRFRHNFDDSGFGGTPWYMPQLVLRQGAQADHLPKTSQENTGQGRTDTSPQAGIKRVARAHTAQTQNQEPQLPAGPSFLLRSMQREHVVNHHLKKT